MKIKPKEVKRTVGILTDPQPNWTALVDHGANQTPWNSVKRDPSLNPAEDEDQENNDMAIRAGKGSKRQPVITRLTFQKSLFATTADVQKWMTDKGFEGFNIEDEQDAWAAKSTEDYSKLNLSKAVNTPGKDPGVTVSIAEVLGKKDDDDEDEEDEEDGEQSKAGKRAKAKEVKPKETNGKTSKAKTNDNADAGDEEDEEEVATDTVLVFPEATKKFDIWGAYMSESGSLMGVLKDGMGYDGIPPGVDEVLTAVYLTTGNILTDEDATPEAKAAALKQLGEDYATLVLGLDELFNAVDDDKGSDAAKAAKKGWLDSLAAAAATKSANVIKTEADESEDDEAEDETDGEEEADGEADDDNATEGEQEPTEAKAGNKNPKAKKKSVKQDNEVLAFLKTEILPKVEKAVSTAEEAKKTVAKVAGRVPTRKSLADAADDLVDMSAVSKRLEEQREQDTAEKTALFGGFFGRVGGGKAH